MNAVIIKPIITEKYVAQQEKGVYAFVVDTSANKITIKQAVEQMYGVNVVNVRTMRTQGKAKSRYTKAGWVKGRNPNLKKAIVSLAEGEIIDLYSDII